ncbi:hypothetical protein CU633_19780 [Bacillus sp. V3-13]|uniref:DUF3221 domain-containing protein n=1 Tax=Bacillus sp. V3-13 TaxID=2053728 RepID=UPI000C78DD61|nr:DUF3221 domain-containing protein [Bacillus sp. V3-13]PLR75672.1 hypothetical protein CU633_19780 [Bacillus sp. V3-13]
MKHILLIVFLALGFTLTGCGEKHVENENDLANEQHTEGSQIQGYIVFIRDSERTILVRDENFNIQDINLPLKELQKKYEDIMLLVVEERPNHIKSGQKVEVGWSKILESDPPQVVVTRIEKIEN